MVADAAALGLALGHIFYISAVNDEVSQWKRPENATDDQVFTYQYGWAYYDQVFTYQYGWAFYDQVFTYQYGWAFYDQVFSYQYGWAFYAAGSSFIFLMVNNFCYAHGKLTRKLVEISQ